MREIDWKLSKENDFSGVIRLAVPKYKARLELVKDLGIKYTDDGKADLGQSMDSAIKLFDMVEKHVKKVAIVHKKTKIEIKSLEDLEYHPEGQVIINELSGLLINGVPLGNG